MPLVIPGSAEHARREAERVLQAHAWPAELRALLVRLQSTGARAHLVGGPVRDVLLGRAGDPRWDIATSLTPEQVRATVARVEPIGERHGTLLVIEHGLLAEVTTFRREGAYSDARHPDQVWWTEDPIADLARRDLTVNALAFDPVSGTLLDPFEGARDLQRKRLRAVGDPYDRLNEDALRALRVARFAAVLEMTPDEATREAMASVIERARSLAVERVRDEFCKLMSAREPSRGWELLRGSGLLEVWLPEVAACHAVPQNRFHAYDVYFHLLHSCDAATPDRPVVRWAALLHDIGKPLTRGTRSDGDSSFHGHEKVGAELAHALLTRLRFPNEERDQIVHLVREHMFDFRAEWSDAAVRRFVRRVGVEQIADLFDLRMADAIGNGLKQPDVTRLAALSERVDRLLEAPHALGLGDLEVSGADVMEVAGLPPGPDVGALLERLLEEVLEDPARNTREWLCARIAEWSERPGRP